MKSKRFDLRVRQAADDNGYCCVMIGRVKHPWKLVAAAFLVGIGAYVMLRPVTRQSPAANIPTPFSRVPQGKEPAASFHDSSTSSMVPQMRTIRAVDLNTAPLSELETIPGISPDYARKIAAGRPYQSISDLEHIGIPKAVLAQISPPAIIKRSVPAGPLANPLPVGAPPGNQPAR
jgi:competence protein ComEA